MTTISGKAIYTPKGRAQEYAPVACNFFTGCSHNCTYCYCKRGVLGKTWSIVPKLKKCFHDEAHALECFQRDILKNLKELEKRSIFFSFTTDPFLNETSVLTVLAARACLRVNIPVQILTKGDSEFIPVEFFQYHKSTRVKDVAFGKTLTGHNELEPGAPSNEARIESNHQLHELGFKTIISIEPIIDFDSSLHMIAQTIGDVDQYKIGLLSGDKPNPHDLIFFVDKVNALISEAGSHVYWKESITDLIPIEHSETVVDCNYNIFTNK